MADTDPAAEAEALMAHTHAMVAQLRALLQRSDTALQQQGLDIPHPSSSAAVAKQAPAPHPPHIQP